MLPMLYRSTFSVSTPENMADVSRMVLIPAVRAFTQDIPCPTEPTISDIVDVLDTMFIK